MGATDPAILAALVRLERKLDALAARLPDRRHNALLARFLTSVSAFASSPWAAGELIENAQFAGAEQLCGVLGDIAGEADPARALGCFCARHEGIAIDNLQIVRTKGLWSVCAVRNA